MPVKEPRVVRDGMLNALGGIDSGRSPSLIAENQLAFAVNCSMRGGFPGTRPPLFRRSFVFEDSEQEEWFLTKRMQGAAFYRPRNVLAFVGAMIGGRLFKIELDRFAVSEITPILTTTTASHFPTPVVGLTDVVTVADASGIEVGYPVFLDDKKFIVTDKDSNQLVLENVTGTPGELIGFPAVLSYLVPSPQRIQRVWFLQAKHYWIVQDGETRPIIFDGSASRRSVVASDEPEVPVGTVMAYVGRRIWVATPGGDVAAGDIDGGPTSIIKFTEELVTETGGRFSIGEEVTAMIPAVILDTSMGQGPLQIFTRNSANSINVPANRALWQDLGYPVQTVSLIGNGALSQYATINVNSDLHYRSEDGWRSFLIARREVNEWGNVPVSTEMARPMDYDAETLLPCASAILFDNRVLFTVAPYQAGENIAHKGIAALDLSLVSRMGQKSPPAWEGVWTGIRTTMLLAGEHAGNRRAFAFAVNGDGQNELWEFLHRPDPDNGDAPIQCAIETRSLTFRSPVDLKAIEAVEIWIDNLRGSAAFDLKWKPDFSQCWYDWGTKTVCSTVEDCEQDLESCKTIKNYRPGYRSRLSFGKPPEQCDEQSGKPADVGYEFQVRLAWSGNVQIRKMVVKARLLEEEVYPACD